MIFPFASRFRLPILGSREDDDDDDDDDSYWDSYLLFVTKVNFIWTH